MTLTYIGLGSNLSEPITQVNAAIEAIKNIAQSQVTKISSLYLSKPMGPQDQDDYINAVLSLETNLEPLALLDTLQALENKAGRIRKDNRWGARILDLDILLFGNEIISTERLTIPHYGLHEREFVLLPLAEISPELMLPTGESIKVLSQQIAHNAMIRLS